MLTGNDLRGMLEQLTEDELALPVLLQKDPEGNGFFWLTGVDTDGYVEAEDLERDRTDNVTTLDDLSEGIDPNDQDSIDEALEGFRRVLIIFP